jgi:hypothetical protein
MMNEKEKKEKVNLEKITLQMLQEDAFNCDGSESEQKKIREQLEVAWKVYAIGTEFNNEAYELEGEIGYSIGDKINDTFINDIKNHIIYLSSKLVVFKVVYNTIYKEQKEIMYD